MAPAQQWRGFCYAYAVHENATKREGRSGGVHFSRRGLDFLSTPDGLGCKSSQINQNKRRLNHVDANDKKLAA